MAKATLLDTRTATYAELVGNGKRHVVPAYQRDYSWEEENWEDLWNDLLEMSESADSRHYMGAIVVQSRSDREMLIIDGQQRLATLSILSIAIIERLQSLAAAGIDPDPNRERAQELRKRYVGEKDPASLIVSGKLKLNETDNGFYEDYLVAGRSPANVRSLAKSCRLLWNCKKWLDEHLAELSFANDGPALARLLNETVARQFLFILITVDDELSAYTVFETLNARGLELSATDLLKNYLFSKVNAVSDLANLQRRWTRMISVVKSERFPELLRYHLACEMPQVRNRRLFKTVKAKITKAQDVFELIQVLEDRSELFAALSDTTHEFWIDRPDCKRWIAERVLLKSMQSTPLLFATWDRLNDQFERILKLLNVITFRYSTVCQRNANVLEPIYHRAAREILDGRSKKYADVFQSLKDVYVDDESFRKTLEVLQLETAGNGKRVTQYMLQKLEIDCSSGERNWETDPGSIEHILPENPSAEWLTTIPEESWNTYAYRLGNLTLLEKSLNRGVGNSTFAVKLPAYEKSQYRLTTAIAENPPDEWTTAAIGERQAHLAKRAVHIWRAD
jgi:hypothetical protein